MANSLGSDAVIKVTTEVLYEKSQSISGHLGKMQERFSNMESVVDKTGGYWIGEAGEAHRAMYKEMCPQIEEVTKRLQEHVRDLEEMAGIYDEAASAARELAEELPADVIL